MDVATHQIKVHMCMTKASLDVFDCWEMRTERREELEVVINERRRNSRSMYAPTSCIQDCLSNMVEVGELEINHDVNVSGEETQN